jgi:hypothetical protein
MLSLFYLNLSKLSDEKLIQGGYIGHSVGLLPQYIFLAFLIYASITTYKHRIFEGQFSQSPRFGRFVDKMLSLIMLISILIFTIKHWP